MLTIYRRHNLQHCKPKDVQRCHPNGELSRKKWKPCPIWVRGNMPDGAYIRQPIYERDWTKALYKARQMEATGEEPRPAPVAEDKPTIELWRDQFLLDRKTENVSEETLRKYRLLFRQLFAYTTNKGIRFVDELDLAALQEFRNSWKDQSLSKLKKQERLRSIFKFALARNWVSENTALKLGRIRVDRTQQLPFDEEEMKRILKAAKKAAPQVYPFVLVMRYSGLRISDTCMLRRDSLHDRHLILRTQKTSTPVKILLPKVVAQALQSLKPASRDHFFWNGTSKLTSVTDLWRSRLVPIFSAAKIEDAHPHRFRHTFAVNLLKHGTPAGLVARLLGNTEQIVIKHYDAWIEARQRLLDDAVEAANGYHHLR